MDEKKELRELLDEAIRGGIERLNSAQTSGDYADQAESVSKLYKLRMEEIENDRNFIAKSDETVDKERDYQLRQEQISDEKRSRKLKFVTDLLGVLLPIGLYAVCFSKGLKFEQEGTYTSTTVRGLLSKLKIR